MDLFSLGLKVDTSEVEKGTKRIGAFDKAAKKAGTTGKSAGGLVNKSFLAGAQGIDTATRSGTGLTNKLGGIKTLVGGIGIIALGRNALNMASNFDSAMNTVQSKLLISDDAMVMLRDRAKELGAQTQFSASEAGDAMGFLAQAGLDAVEIYDAMPATLNLAAASGMDLASSADIATNVMGAFALEVKDLTEITDILAITSAKSNTSVQELSQVLLKAGPIANELGVDLQSVSGIAGQLANAGFKSQRAGTIMMNMFTNLLTPVGQGKEALEELNITQNDMFESMEDGSLRFRGMSNMMQLLELRGVDAADKMKIFGRIAGPGMLTLLKSGELSLEQLTMQLEANGQAAEAAEIRQKGLPGSLKQLASAWEGLNLAVMEGGGSGGMMFVIDGITLALRWMTTTGIQYFDNFVDGIRMGFISIRPYFDAGVTLITQFKNAFQDVQQSIPDLKNFGELDKGSESVQKLAGALKKVIDFLKPLTPYIDEVVIAFVALKTAGIAIGVVVGVFGSLSSAALLLNPVVIAVAAVAAGAYVLMDNWDGIVKWWSNLWSDIQLEGDKFTTWWNTTSFSEKFLDLSSASILTAEKLSNQFFSWWDTSTLKTKSPEFVVKGIDDVQQLANKFFAWWRSSTLAEKVANFKTSGIEFAQKTAKDLSDWWHATTFTEKVLMIAQPGLDKLKTASTTFFKWWEQSVFKEKTASIKFPTKDDIQSSLDSVRSIWNSISFRDIVLKLQDSQIRLAGQAITSVKSLWDGSEFKAKSPEIVTTLVDGALSMIQKVVDLWREWKPLEKIVNISTGAVDKAKSLIGEAITLWNNSEFKAKAVAVTTDLLTTAKTKTQEFVGWWTSTTLEEKIGWVRTDGVEEFQRQWDGLNIWFKNLAKDLLSNFLTEANNFDYSKIGAAVGTGFGTLTAKLFNIGAEFIKNLFTGAGDPGPISQFVSGFFKNFVSSFKAESDQGVQAIKDLGTLMIERLKQEGKELGEAAKQLGRDVISSIKDSLSVNVDFPFFDRFRDDATKKIRETVKNVNGELDGFFDSRASDKLFEKALKAGGELTAGLVKGIDPDVVKDVSERLAKVPLETFEEINEIRSPSRVFFRFGEFIAQGVSDGILASLNLPANASAIMAKEVADSFNDIKEELGKKLLALTEGEDALRRYELAQEGLKDEAIEFVIAAEDEIDALEAIKTANDKAADEIANLKTEQYLQNIELTQGKDAAFAAELELRNYTQAQIDTAVETAKGIEIQRQFHDGLVDAISNADSVKDAIGNLGDFLKDWLKEKIAYFLANKILVGVGLAGGSEGLGSLLSGLLPGGGGGVDPALEAFGGAGPNVGGGSGLASLLGGSHGLGGNGFSSLLGSDAIGGLGAAAGGFSGGQAISQLLGRENDLSGPLGSIGSTVGFALGGPLGAALGTAAGAVVSSAFGTSFSEVARGFEIGVSDGIVIGQNFVTEERERSLFRGTKTRETFSALDPEIEANVQSYFSQLNDSIITSAEMFGTAGADSILDGFNIAVQRFEGENAQAELQEWLSTSTRQAYQAAFWNLEGDIQGYLNGTVDVFNGTAEEIEAAFAMLSNSAQIVVPALEAIGLSLGDTTAESVANGARLVDAFGGLEPALATLDQYVREFVPESQKAGDALGEARQQLGEWNNAIGGTRTSFVGLTRNLDTYRESLDGNTEAGRRAIEQIDAFVSADSRRSDVMRINIEELQAYQNTLDLSTQAGREASASIDELSMVFSNTGQNLINTREGLNDYINSLDLSTEAGRQAAVVALEQMDAINLVIEAQERANATVSGFAEVANLLNINFDAASPSALTFADTVVELIGGFDELTTASNQYYNDFYTAEERAQITLAETTAQVAGFNESLGLTGEAAIDTKEEFRAYVEGLDDQTEAGARALASALSVSGALADFTEESKSLDQVVSEIPEHLRAEFDNMRITAVEQTNAMTQAANDAFIEQQAIALNQSDTLIKVSTETAVGMVEATKMGANETIALLHMTAGQTVAATGEATKAIVDSSESIKTAANGVAEGFIADSIAGENAEKQFHQVAARLDEMSVAGVNNEAQTRNLTGTLVRGGEQIIATTAITETQSRSMSTLRGAQLEANQATLHGANVTTASANASQYASNKMVGMVGSINSVAHAAERAANQINNAARNLNNINISSYNNRSLDGSHRSGLGRVPFDGYVAEVHKDEMIIPPGMANFLRDAGIPMVTNIEQSQPTVSMSDGMSEKSDEMLEKIYKALMDNSEKSSNDSQRQSTILTRIAAGTNRQTEVLDDVERSQDRLARALTR